MSRLFSRYGLTLVFQILLVMYLVQLVNEFTGGALRTFGVQPRVPVTLPFIFSAPFVHGSWLHLANNSVGFLIFSCLCLVRGKRFFGQASVIIITVGGLLVWLFGRPAVHIGASGWIFGLWSLTIAMAWFEKSVLNFVVAIFVILLYGGMIVGVVPSQPGVSFESHAFGAAAAAGDERFQSDHRSSRE